MVAHPGSAGLFLTLAGALLLSPPARSQSVLPLRDAELTVRVTGAAADAIPALSAEGSAPVILHLRWSSAERRLRVDAGSPQIAVVDLQAHRADIIDTALHAALRLTMRARDVTALTLTGAHFTPRGRSVVLGHACRRWEVQEPHGSGTICVTGDGVPLQGDGEADGRRGSFEALSLSFAPQPAQLFTVPPGYARLEFPHSMTAN